MAVLEIWRDITVNVTPGFDQVNRYTYDTATNVTTAVTPFNVPTGSFGVIHPPFGTVMYSECVTGDLLTYTSRGNNTGLDIDTITNSPSCCPIELNDFLLERTNNTNVTPNGTIKVTSTEVDINDYEASINGGASWVAGSGGEINFSGLPGDNYTVIIREISGYCSVSGSITVNDVLDYPPLIVSEETLPALYAPVFYPITMGFLLVDNQATVKTDGGGTYLELASEGAKGYLQTKPIFKILNNEDYGGTYQITGFDDPDDPEKFYFDGTWTSDQAVILVPLDRQVFQLYAETAVNDFEKIADISVYPDQVTGEYKIRLEGFLQAVFSVIKPINDGIELTLLRKYYVIPKEFDADAPATILNAVYSAIPDLTNYLGSLIPLGPAPINFINEQTQKGIPVLFSYIDTVDGRIKNVTSSEQTDVVSSSELVYIAGLPLNVYDLTWINPAGAIGTLNVAPSLPPWITIVSSPSDTVKLHIDTGMGVSGGDYDGSDYDGDDYLTGGPNAIVGCYTFDFTDGVDELFTLTICIYPLQKSNGICGEIFNIAWVNREGGWSSYPFEGRKVHGKAIGDSKTFKKFNELKKATVEDVYDTAEVSIFNRSVKDLQFIASLRQSIQAYLYSEETQQWSIPIILDKNNFEVYTTPFKQIKVDDKFTFRYSEEIIIQSQ